MSDREIRERTRSDMLSVQLPQASMPDLMCGWGCHMGLPEASGNPRVRRAIYSTNAVCGKAFVTGFANL